MERHRAQILRKMSIILIVGLLFNCFYPTLLKGQSSFASSLPKPSIGSVNFERAITQLVRSSEWKNESLDLKSLSQILWAAYGYSLRGSGHRTVPSAHGAYPLLLLVAKSDGVYEFRPRSHSLDKILSEDLRDEIRSRCSGPHANSVDGAPVLLIVFAHKEKLKERIFRFADAGCVAQNVFCQAATHQIGTNFVTSENLVELVGIDDAYETIGVMPLGYPTVPLPVAGFPTASETLPAPRESSKSLEEAMSLRRSIRSWTGGTLNSHELSQILWSASQVVTNNSIRIFLAGSSNVEEYLIGSHDLMGHIDGDKRLTLAESFVGQTWAARAPHIVVIAFDESRDSEGKSQSSMQHFDAGLVMQNVYLSATAWELGTVVIGGGWNPIRLRDILQLPPYVVPLYIMPIGHTSFFDLYEFGARISLFAIPLFYVSSLVYLPRSRRILKKRRARWIHCGTAIMITLAAFVHVFLLGILGIISGHENDFRYYLYAIYRVFLVDFQRGYSEWVLGQLFARISLIALVVSTFTGISFNWLSRRRLLSYRRVRLFHQASILVFASTMLLHAAINGSVVTKHFNLFLLINMLFLGFWATLKYWPHNET